MSEIRDDQPKADPNEVLAMSEEDVVRGTEDELRERRYALLAGQAEVWDEESEEHARADRVIDLLEAALPVGIEPVL